MLVAAHCNSLPELAAGMKALPDTAASFSHTQALWRFLRNERVTPARLNAPLLVAAREAVADGCERYALTVHDWSRLNYNTHSSKCDRLQMTHETDLGYELQTSLLIGDGLGQPLSPVAQNLVTAQGVLSTYASPGAKAQAHLDELTERMRWLEGQNLGKPLVHIVDREADSVDHLRQWSAAGWHWLIRAKGGSRVQADGQDTSLEGVAQGLCYSLAREVEYQGKRGRQWVAETTVVLARPAKPKRKDSQGQRVKPKAGEPLSVRLVVSRIEDEAGQAVAVWYLLSHLPTSVAAEEVALWYYYRWRIESFFKLLKQAGHQVECWEQESGAALFKRLLIACQSCVLTWRILRAQGAYAEQVQRFLVRLSGRQTKRLRPVTAPAVLSGLHTLFALLELLEHYSLDELKAFAHFAYPTRYQAEVRHV